MKKGGILSEMWRLVHTYIHLFERLQQFFVGRFELVIN